MSTVPSGLGWLRSELKRRKVYGTAVAYGVGAFGLLQAVDLVGPALGWPDRLLTYLVIGAVAAAPVVVALAWHFDVRREHPLPEAPDREQPPGRIRPPSSLALMGLAFLASGLLLWLLWPGELMAVADFEAGDRILISRCGNGAGDSELADVLNVSLTASIRQSSHVEVVSHSQVRAYAESYLGREGEVFVDPDLADEYALRTGLKVVVHCTVAGAGPSRVVTASIFDPRRQEDLALFSEEAGEADQLLPAIDRLSGRIRLALGEALPSVEEAKPLAEVTTPSLDALISYTSSIEAEARGDAEEMRRLLELALSRDSLFARAHSGLAIYHYFRGNIPEGEAHYRVALGDPNRIAERDRLWIEASWASDRRETERAITLYSAYLERWPSDADGWYNLGTQNFHLGRCDPAREAFQRALSLNPTLASAYVNLASCHARIGQVDSALALYDSAFGLRPGWRELTNLNHEYGQLLIKDGRLSEAEALFSGQLDGSPSQQAQGHRSLALLLTRQGRYREARPHLEEAVRQSQALGGGNRLSEYRNRAFLAGVLDAVGDPAGARRERRAIDGILRRSYVSPAWSFHAFRLFLAAGETESARAVLARAEADTLARGAEDRGSLPAMRGWLLLAEGRAEEALEQERLAVETADWAPFVDGLCRIALRAGEVETALESCGELAGPGTGTGWEGQELSILAHYWLGGLHESVGDPAAAAESYARFLACWDGGDQDLRFRNPEGTWVHPQADARERLSGLRRRRG